MSFPHLSHASPRRPRPRGVRAFTLIEIIVVILIIVVLMGILIPGVLAAVKSAKRKKTEATMGAIQTALEAYKNDHHGRYPQVAGGNTGFAELGKALVGVYGDGLTGTPPNQTPDNTDPPPITPGREYKPGDCVRDAASSPNIYVALVANANPNLTDIRTWARFDCNDLEDGAGTRVVVGGRKMPPYLEPDRFRIQGSAILDADEKPILYFPSRGSPNISLANSYAALGVGKYDLGNNVEFFTRLDDPVLANAVQRMQAMLGDLNFNGAIDSGETAVSNGPYILWAAGPDGFYGPARTKAAPYPVPTGSDAGKCDDVIVPHQ
jgi:prepilin-type N-terminal cleavage/methylation domain-containing protein